MKHELKKGIALVLRGPQGCGKSTLAREIAAQYGSFIEIESTTLATLPHDLNNALASEPSTLIIDVTQKVKSVLALVALKEIITSKTLRIDLPHHPPRQVKTPNFIFCSGTEYPFPNIQPTDRRFVVVDLPAKPKEQQ